METKSRDAYPIIYIGNMRLGTGPPDVGARSDLLAGSTRRLPHFSRGPSVSRVQIRPMPGRAKEWRHARRGAAAGDRFTCKLAGH